MTALAGGAADKLGNRYEFWWTVSELIRMLYGKAESIRIEDPGTEKAEFVVTSGKRRTLHQAKRSHPNGKWTLAALGTGDDQLLQKMFDQLLGNADQFIFVSGSHAEELDTLAERARGAESLKEYISSFIDDPKHAKHFEKLRGSWHHADSAIAYEVLRRIEVRTVDEESIKEKVKWALPALFLADPEGVASALLRIVQDAVHETITRSALVEQLAKKGYALRQLCNIEDAGLKIDQVTDNYLAVARRKLIRGSLVSRSITMTLLDRIDQSTYGSECVLTGKAGVGKTGCVVELIEPKFVKRKKYGGYFQLIFVVSL